MSTYKIYNYKAFDISKISYEKPTSGRGGTYVCYLDSDHEVLFQTKAIPLKRDAVENDKEAYIVLDLSDSDLKDFIEELNKSNIQYIFENCRSWFNRDLPFDTVQEFYKNLIDENNCIKLPIPRKKKQIQIRVFDNKKNELTYGDLKEGSDVAVLLRLNGIKFLKTACILDIDVVQAIVHLPVESVVIPTDDIVEQTPQDLDKKSELIKRMEFKEDLKKKKEAARLAFEESEHAQLKADELKEIAMKLASELKEMEEAYNNDLQEEVVDDSEEED